MFTGLVDDIGVIDRVASTDAGRELRIACRYEDLEPGESIAVSGVCLTVVDPAPRFFHCAAVSTTLAVTTIGTWVPGRRVNLERALRVGDRLGGHFVQGHVDGVARVVRAEREGDALLVDLALPDGLSDFMVDRGSIAVDGVSLTIRELRSGSDRQQRSFRLSKEIEVVQVSIIEYTREFTTLGTLRAGDSVHVEADMLAKHVQKLLAPFQDS